MQLPLQTLTIVGVGLIGGSIGLAAKKRGVVEHVLGVGRDQVRLDKALKLGAIDEGSFDVADAVRLDSAAAEIEDSLGPIDVWVNNAMATVFAPIVETTPDEFRRATEVTYLGSVWGTMAALRAR